jgi:ribosome recycling factor
MIDDWLKDAEERMDKSVEALHKDMSSIRTGRATPALVDRLQVEYYGTPTPLLSLASITAPEARLLVIQPYDRSAMAAIEKAIQLSQLGLNPSNDGTMIRIPVPPLTEERRKEFVKMAKQKAEAARVAIRNIRRDEVEHIRKIEKDGEVGSDELDRGLAHLQKITDRFVAKVDEVAHRKEQEILEV